MSKLTIVGISSMLKNSGVWKVGKQGENITIRLALSLDHVKARGGYCHHYVSKEWRRKKYTPSFNFA